MCNFSVSFVSFSNISNFNLVSLSRVFVSFLYFCCSVAVFFRFGLSGVIGLEVNGPA